MNDLIIVGGGLNGTVLALAAAKMGLSSTLIDATPTAIRRDDGFDGRGYALALSSQRILANVGIWGPLAGHACPIMSVDVKDGKIGRAPSPFALQFDPSEVVDGPIGYMIEDRHLRREVIDQIDKNELITVVRETVIAQSVAEASVTITLDSGDTIEGRVVVGSDGKNSQVAKRAGIKRVGWPYRQQGLVCALEHEKPHGNCASQIFFPAGPLAILPLTANRSSIVWTEKDDLAAQINALDDLAYLEVLQPRVRDVLGEVSLTGARFSYPISLSVATRFVADRLALVGDAAHTVHPLAGQGLNAGLKDVAALVDVLISAQKRGEDIGRLDVLERYEQWRRFDVATLAAATDSFNRLFSNDNAAIRLARDLGLAAFNAAGPLRRAAMKEAAGLTGELPSLMRDGGGI